MNADFLVDFPGLGIHDIPVRRVAFEVFGFEVYWYGLLIASAIVLCLILASRHAPRYQMKSDDILDTFILIIPMSIVLARLSYVVFEWPYYAEDWRRIIEINQGGLMFYGGVAGGVLAVVIMCRIKKIPVSRMFDFLAVYLPLGQAIGRWGNFFNQEAFGSNTRLPWGMISNQTTFYLTRIGGYQPDQPVHPTFLYEFIGNMLIFILLLAIRRRNKTPFRVLLYYFLLYGIMRFFVEAVRTDSLYIPNTDLRVSMVISAVMVVFSLILLMVLRQRQQRNELKRQLESDIETDETSSAPADPTDETVSESVLDRTESDAGQTRQSGGSDFVPLADNRQHRQRQGDADHRDQPN
ncbi:MAG: prolipoprotein diacylglyceryl transferase [Clostridia bacterium]|nr:prolipoprotein diacylglyceryl transferase [Eubacteriales bacterium]MDD3866235.1 prolipoprotein diacylglyceryl transferase [Eubacteriales bacterium]MDD4460749.1 prolipoprotein diacylglyceryl transferase [Eubacteriales bacterium]NCC48855.1 prolipoprotein diacylglyceryl transferase [Clostridia bacterium]